MGMKYQGKNNNNNKLIKIHWKRVRGRGCRSEKQTAGN